MDDTINTSNLERLRLKRRLKAQRRMMRIKADPERYKAYLEKCRNSANKANQKKYNDPEKYRKWLEENRIRSLRFYNERIRVNEERYNKLKEYNKQNHKQYILKIKSDPVQFELYKTKQKEEIKKNGKLRKQRHVFKRLAKSANRQYKNGTVTPFDLWKIAKKQKCKCVFTGQKLTSDNMSADHIISKSKGGLNVPSNIRLVLKPINIARQNMTDEEFVDLCKSVVNYSS